MDSMRSTCGALSDSTNIIHNRPNLGDDSSLCRLIVENESCLSVDSELSSLSLLASKTFVSGLAATEHSLPTVDFSIQQQDLSSTLHESQLSLTQNEVNNHKSLVKKKCSVNFSFSRDDSDLEKCKKKKRVSVNLVSFNLDDSNASDSSLTEQDHEKKVEALRKLDVDVNEECPIEKSAAIKISRIPVKIAAKCLLQSKIPEEEASGTVETSDVNVENNHIEIPQRTSIPYEKSPQSIHTVKKRKSTELEEGNDNLEKEILLGEQNKKLCLPSDLTDAKSLSEPLSGKENVNVTYIISTERHEEVSLSRLSVVRGSIYQELPQIDFPLLSSPPHCSPYNSRLSFQDLPCLPSPGADRESMELDRSGLCGVSANEVLVKTLSPELVRMSRVSAVQDDEDVRREDEVDMNETLQVIRLGADSQKTPIALDGPHLGVQDGTDVEEEAGQAAMGDDGRKKKPGSRKSVSFAQKVRLRSDSQEASRLKDNFSENEEKMDVGKETFESEVGQREITAFEKQGGIQDVGGIAQPSGRMTETAEEEDVEMEIEAFEEDVEKEHKGKKKGTLSRKSVSFSQRIHLRCDSREMSLPLNKPFSEYEAIKKDGRKVESRRGMETVGKGSSKMELEDNGEVNEDSGKQMKDLDRITEGCEMPISEVKDVNEDSKMHMKDAVEIHEESGRQMEDAGVVNEDSKRLMKNAREVDGPVGREIQDFEEVNEGSGRRMVDIGEVNRDSGKEIEDAGEVHEDCGREGEGVEEVNGRKEEDFGEGNEDCERPMEDSGEVNEGIGRQIKFGAEDNIVSGKKIEGVEEVHEDSERSIEGAEEVNEESGKEMVATGAVNEDSRRQIEVGAVHEDSRRQMEVGADINEESERNMKSAEEVDEESERPIEGAEEVDEESGKEKEVTERVNEDNGRELEVGAVVNEGSESKIEGAEEVDEDNERPIEGAEEVDEESGTEKEVTEEVNEDNGREVEIGAEVNEDSKRIMEGAEEVDEESGKEKEASEGVNESSRRKIEVSAKVSEDTERNMEGAEEVDEYSEMSIEGTEKNEESGKEMEVTEGVNEGSGRQIEVGAKVNEDTERNMEGAEKVYEESGKEMEVTEGVNEDSGRQIEVSTKVNEDTERNMEGAEEVDEYSEMSIEGTEKNEESGKEMEVTEGVNEGSGRQIEVGAKVNEDTERNMEGAEEVVEYSDMSIEGTEKVNEESGKEMEVTEEVNEDSGREMDTFGNDRSRKTQSDDKKDTRKKMNVATRKSVSFARRIQLRSDSHETSRSLDESLPNGLPPEVFLVPRPPPPLAQSRSNTQQNFSSTFSKPINDLSYDSVSDISAIPLDETIVQKKIIYHSTPKNPIVERHALGTTESSSRILRSNSKRKDQMIQVSKSIFGSSSEGTRGEKSSKDLSTSYSYQGKTRTSQKGVKLSKDTTEGGRSGKPSKDLSTSCSYQGKTLNSQKSVKHSKDTTETVQGEKSPKDLSTSYSYQGKTQNSQKRVKLSEVTTEGARGGNSSQDLSTSYSYQGKKTQNSKKRVTISEGVGSISSFTTSTPSLPMNKRKSTTNNYLTESYGHFGSNEDSSYVVIPSKNMLTSLHLPARNSTVNSSENTDNFVKNVRFRDYSSHINNSTVYSSRGSVSTRHSWGNSISNNSSNYNQEENVSVDENFEEVRCELNSSQIPCDTNQVSSPEELAQSSSEFRQMQFDSMNFSSSRRQKAPCDGTSYLSIATVDLQSKSQVFPPALNIDRPPSTQNSSDKSFYQSDERFIVPHPPKKAFPDKWVHPKLLQFLSSKLRVNGVNEVEVNSIAHRMIAQLCACVRAVSHLSDPDDIHSNTLIIRNVLFKYNICKTSLEYYLFLIKYTPIGFCRKVSDVSGELAKCKLNSPIFPEVSRRSTSNVDA